MMNKFFFPLGVFIASFIFGFSILKISKNFPNIDRDPAAAQKGYDISNPLVATSVEAMKKRVLEGYKVIDSGSDKWIYLGHFLFTNPSLQRKYGCEVFDQVQVTFIADGEAHSGVSPTMVVKGECLSSQDITQIGPFKLPVQDVRKETPGDGDFQFRQGQNLNVSFKNISDQWPTTWVVVAIKLENTINRESLILLQQDIQRYSPYQPLVMRWPPSF
ncbi:MAG: hypothetical protein ACOYOK_13255 [Pseudobdellovibrionaceae bacterium]